MKTSKTSKRTTKTKFPSSFDVDGDGVPNWFDCRPYDARFQHVRPNKTMEARLRKLPIYFTTSRGTFYEIIHSHTFYTLQDKQVPRDVEILRQRFYSMIKKRPDVVGEIERTKPYAIFFTKRGFEPIHEAGYSERTINQEPLAPTEDKVPGKHLAVIRLTSFGRGHAYRRDSLEEGAGTTHHELEHIKQYERWKNKPQLQKRMSKGGYTKRKEEQLACQAEEKAFNKRYSRRSYPSPEAYYAGIRRITSFDEE